MSVYLFPALRFRFGDAEDVASYGGRWWSWNERAVTRLRGRELIALEETVGMPLITLIERMRDGSTAATMAAMWIALHLGGHQVAWSDFNPVVNAADWEREPEEEPDPLASGESPTPGSNSSPPPPVESATS